MLKHANLAELNMHHGEVVLTSDSSGKCRLSIFGYICNHGMKSKKSRISLISRAIAFLMAIYLFNFSIDSRDAHSDSVAEDLSINDIESVYEFLAESMFGVENAVEEHDERDQDDGGSFEFKKFYFTPLISRVQVKAAEYISERYSPVDYCPALAMRASEIHSPPPRA